MTHVVVYTEDGQVVGGVTDVRYSDLMLARIEVPNTKGQAFFGTILRAVQDAEAIQEGRDPERPSEKVMRLAAEARREQHGE